MKVKLILSSLVYTLSSVHALPLEQIDDFSYAFDLIKKHYVEEVSEDQLMNYAIKGMVAHLDPHSSYLDKEELSSLQNTTSGKFGGIGIELTVEQGLIKIITPIDDSPAAQGGILPGDIIVAIDGTFTQGMSIGEAAEKMRGQPGTKLKLTIARDGAKTPLEFTLTRSIIASASVKGEILEKQWAYLRISTFAANTGEEFRETLNKLLKQKPKGVVLDLRNNPGGVLKSSAQVANCFLDEAKVQNKVIVSAKGRDSKPYLVENVTGGDLTKGLPMVIIVNSGSASASEIVAGAIQDHRRAVILGDITFGKGSVQTIIPLNGKALKLTSSRYYTPLDRSIQAQGIIPDILVKNQWQKIISQENGLSLKEANLNNHLQQKDTSVKHAELSEKYAADYQLIESLNVLKALAISGNKL